MVQAYRIRLNSGIDPIIKAFLEVDNANTGPKLYELSPKEARAVLLKAQAVNVPKLPADIEDRDLPTGPSCRVSVRIVRPKGALQALPVIMYFHGGGWVLGDKETHDRLIREIANGANAAVVFVNYSSSPEAKFPTPIEEAYAATKYVAENGKELNLDSNRLAVAGDSVGGNMATVVAMLAKERKGPNIRFQNLFYPVTDANFDTQSYRDYSTGYFLTREDMTWFWDNYLPDENARKQPTASPLRSSLDQLKGLPPTLVIVGEFDVLRDEGEAYTHKLIDAGVQVTAVRMLGAIHDFVMLNAITNASPPRAAIAFANNYLQKALK